MADAEKEEDMEQDEDRCNFLGNNDEWDAGKQVYFNDVIMRQVVSFVNDIKDRQNLELCSIIMNDLSSRVPYISYDNDNSVLDMYFTRVEPVMNISIAGNDFKVMALTSNVRRTCVNSPVSQSSNCILKMQNIIKRFSRQIHRLHIGGISDFERRLGYIPDHQGAAMNVFLPTEFRDFASIVSVHNFWKRGKIISLRLQRKTIMNIAERLRTLPTKLSILYIAIDHRTFRTVEQARQLFKEVSKLAKNCIFVRVSRVLSANLQITTVELDLGPLRKNMRSYDQFFAGLPYMSQLRVLRLFGFLINYDCMNLWKLMLRSIAQLSQITELSIINLLRNIRIDELKAFCGSLPANLNTFALHHVHQLQDDHFSLIAQRCPRLDTLYVRDLQSVTSDGIMKALMEFRMLTKIAVCHSGPVTKEAYELLANREAMPHIEAVILGGNRDHQNDIVLKPLLHRLPQFRVVGTWNRWRDCEYHLWRSSKAYKELLDASCYADCPGCGKDVSLIDDDDDIP
ncbi:hypothetical protein DINM_003890 [Dirofilaria immitis]|nr:hypothetical protein [Dirofilaria immitis]